MGFHKVNNNNVQGGAADVLIAASSYPMPGQLSEIFDLTTYVPNLATYGWQNIGTTKSASHISHQVASVEWRGEQQGPIRKILTDWTGTADFEMEELAGAQGQTNKALAGGAIIATAPTAGQRRTNWTARNSVPFIHLAFARIDPDGRLHVAVASRVQWDGSQLQRAFQRGEAESLHFTEALFPDPALLDPTSGDPILWYELDSD